MASGSAADKKAEKSTWASAVESINPWSVSRSSTPTPREPPAPPAPKPTNQGGDHSINPIYGISSRRYPPDCPPLKVQWFHAVDIPKRKPQLIKGKKKPDEKPPQPPKKWVPFTNNDTRSIEAAYQGVLEGTESERDRSNSGPTRNFSGPRKAFTSETEESDAQSGTKVPVNEDFLFDVDIEKRELAPVYWLGPVYDVRRGSWFYQEGSTLRPCEENLAAQLEEGYLKCKPWLYPAPRIRSESKSKKGDVTPKASVDNLRAQAAAQADSSLKPMGPPPQPQTHRLFGAWMSSVATYQDSTTAWLNSDGVLSWVTSTMYERFAGGGYMSGVKLVRGYTEPGKTKPKPESSKDEKNPDISTDMKNTEEQLDKARKRRSAPPTTRSDSIDFARSSEEQEEAGKTVIESRGDSLKQQISSLLESENRDVDQEEEAVRKREEKEIQDDYNAPAGETQGREIEHLVLITHGIGQLLGLRMESVNFVHDVNTLRKTIKSVYTTSEDLRALNSEIGGGPGNSRVQVLPVCWRHLLDFPRKREEKKSEQDIGLATTEEDEYPSLDDITVEGVAFARSLISDLALDVLLYQSAYREQISEIVFKEANRIYNLFVERNPGFKGKVHIMGHSLGSAIMFDILCRQQELKKESEQSKNPLRIWPSETRKPATKDPRDLTFDFEVDDFYCLGSPIGLFQMLKGRTIGARHLTDGLPANSPFDPDLVDDPFRTASLGVEPHRISPVTGLPYSVSSPKLSQMFNIFYPSDPISYRIEPLISPAMSSLKPQNLPYTKKGIFGNVAPQGISGIGAKVGQSVSGLWANISAGLANNLLNRSLGLTPEDVAQITASQQQQQQQQHHTPSPGAGTNISTSSGVISRQDSTTSLSQKAAERKRQLAEEQGGRKSISGNDMTLLDDDLETLYSKFQKGRADAIKEEGGVQDEKEREDWLAQENKAAKVRREELKVRALNRNGRVDYSIQEGALDFNPINTIASHMAYWADEDVAHFLVSQLLSRKAEGRDRERK
ncbi:DDHD domain-containing protein [Diaporthe amygdali]|uniref:DDHD domain-containing protein n=1 Tax=Phomopsis amygdali TaxID=1214568 RepID=UPI0022FE7645|nr:DDHD domain-containing protein [Diaporthe amygdali]KAJ0120134.1 DDHD domain-containing protein [Diaporthe amygdali]